MGSGASKYEVKISPENENDRSTSSEMTWIASPSEKILPLSSENVQQVSPLGKGKFGNVFLAKVKGSFHVAIKYIAKSVILANDAFGRIQQEINILEKVNHPFLIHCFGGFDTTNCIALVFEFSFGGELYTRMKSVAKFTEAEAKFYFCEIALGLQYLQEKLNVVYRDLKPENVLLDEGGHIKLCDFGFAAHLKSENDYLKDGCGTAMYIAPEIAGGFTKIPHGYPVDWWSLGCILFEMTTGYSAFGDIDAMNKFEIFNNITHKTVQFPFSMSRPLKTLLKGLLHKDQSKRAGWEQVRTNDWVAKVNWDHFAQKRIMPPWIPVTSATPSSSNFICKSLPLPTDNAASFEATAYCAEIKLPRPRSIQPCRRKEDMKKAGDFPVSKKIGSTRKENYDALHNRIGQFDVLGSSSNPSSSRCSTPISSNIEESLEDYQESKRKKKKEKKKER